MNDYAGTLTPAEKTRLEGRLEAGERGTSNQVVVAIFPSLQGESLEDVSVRLAQTWGIGRRGKDNGVVLLVFLAERRLRLEVGYGLEPTLTDAVASSIVRDVIAPRLREGRLADGLEAGVTAIQQAIGGTYAAPERLGSRSRVPGVALAGLVLMLVTAVPIALMSLAQARRGRLSGTGGPHGRAWGPMPGPGWPGTWGGGGAWGGGGGGGFSGGGGQFGGGGASGSW